MSSGEKIDRLFITPFSFECNRVRSVLDMDAAQDDEFQGKDGQELRVYSALSRYAVQELLSLFGLDNNMPPVLLTYDNAVVTDTDTIIMHFRRKNMLRRDT